MTDRALLLLGEPGTAKSWLSEHLAAAINGDSTQVVQGTAGTTEEQIRYTWNYAMLIAHGPSNEALIKSPIFRAMETGTLARFEEITRCAAEVQDALISLLSEKRVSVPELATEIPAAKGFSIIATANTRDRGVNDMSAALKRRFNMVVLPSPSNLDVEVDIVRKRVGELAVNLELKASVPADEAIRQVVTIFRELRPAKRSTARTNSRRRPASCPPQRRFPCWPTAWLWPATSAPAPSPPTTSPPGCKAPSSRTRRRTSSSGTNTCRTSSRNAGPTGGRLQRLRGA